MIDYTINFHVQCYKCGSKITPMQDLEIKKEDFEDKQILHVNFQAFPCDSCIKEIANKIARESIEIITKNLEKPNTALNNNKD